VQFSPLLYECQQGPPSGLQVASILVTQLPETTGIDVQMLDRHFDLRISARKIRIEAVCWLRKRMRLPDDTV
jgi:hypothetical protein